MRREIQQEIRRQMNVVLNAEVGPTTSQLETINKLFPGGPSINQRPVVHPFGFVSRAVQGTISVVARVGDHFANRMVIGHRDVNRPSDINEGESMVYSVGDFRIKVTKTQVLVSKGTDYEPMVVGETLRQLLITLIQAIVAHTHEDGMGMLTSPPLNAATFTAAQSANLDNKKILAESGGRY